MPRVLTAAIGSVKYPWVDRVCSLRCSLWAPSLFLELRAPDKRVCKSFSQPTALGTQAETSGVTSSVEPVRSERAPTDVGKM